MSFKPECFDSKSECFDSKSECFDPKSECIYSQQECCEPEPKYFGPTPGNTPPGTPRYTGSDGVAPKWQEYLPQYAEHGHGHGSSQSFAPPLTNMAPWVPVYFPNPVVYILPVPILVPQAASNLQFAGQAWAQPPHTDTVHCARLPELPTDLQATVAALPVKPGNQATQEPLKKPNLFNAVNRQALQKNREETWPEAEKRRRQSSLPPGEEVGVCVICKKKRSGFRGAKCKTHDRLTGCVADPNCEPCVFADGQKNESYYVSFCYSFGGCSHALMGMCNRRSSGKSGCNFCHCDAPPSHGPMPQRKSRKGQPKKAAEPVKKAAKPVKPSRSHSAPPTRCTEELPSLASKTVTSEDNSSQTTEAETAWSSSSSSSLA